MSEVNDKSSERWQRWGAYALTLCVSLALVFASLRPSFLSEPWMVFFEDDFFYYLKVAQNLSHGLGSTFNGIAPTNGYHPLWFLVLTCFSFFTTNPKGLFLFLETVALLCGLSVYYLSRRILGVAGIGLFPASVIASLVTVYSAPMLFGGMEVTLTVPLVLLVLFIALQPRYWMHGWRSAALFGLAISAMVLSRLDALFFAALLLLLIVSHRSLRRQLHPSTFYGLAIGLIPVVLYFLSNALLFHTLLPVSGMAKQLKHGFLPASPALRSAFDTAPHDQAIVLFIFASIFFVPVLRRRLAPVQQAAYLAALAFPFLYVGLLSCRSDWRLWPWYLYVFRPALCVALLLLFCWPPVERLVRRNSVTTILAVFALALLPCIRWNYEGHEKIYSHAVDLQNFAAGHHGIYAMGDAAGMPAYLLSDPVVQTEGLVMDRPFLTHLQRSEPLHEVLAKYHVRYYAVLTRALPNGCFHAAEPAQAGPASPHMRAELCEAPIAVFNHANVYLLVYDLKSEQPITAP